MDDESSYGPDEYTKKKHNSTVGKTNKTNVKRKEIAIEKKKARNEWRFAK